MLWAIGFPSRSISSSPNVLVFGFSVRKPSPEEEYAPDYIDFQFTTGDSGSVGQLGLFGRSKKKADDTELRLGILTSRLGPDERLATRTLGWEMTPQGEAEIALVVTHQRVIWSYRRGPTDLVLEIWFDDVIAWIGSEDEGGFILEAKDHHYAEISGDTQTTIGRFRLANFGTPDVTVRYIEDHISPEARTLIPDFEGTGHHELYPEF